jgi:hypothetical protein
MGNHPFRCPMAGVRIPLKQRALCLAYIKRNFQALVDRGGEGARVGRWGLRELGRVVALWHQFRDGVIDRQGLQEGLRPIKARFAKLLDYGLGGKTTRRRPGAGSRKSAGKLCGPLLGWPGVEQRTMLRSGHCGPRCCGARGALAPRASEGAGLPKRC